jgi:2-dehydro-3-deoxyphosphogluconate aldolase/(4S)-4-hydroxy-2-oxoglutarate aldolase
MTKAEILRCIVDTGIVPVVRAPSSELAVQAVGAIMAGGVPIVEITMTVPGAVEVIRDLVKTYGRDVLVGAGTVLDAETARACLLAGAEFIVGPALDLETITICHRYGKVVMPGALTPTEVVTAWQAGADLVKVFPASAVGGPSYIKALKAPLPQIELVPTGGVSLKTAAEFIKAGAAALGVGTDLVDTSLLQSGQASVITDRARQFVAIVNEARSHS